MENLLKRGMKSTKCMSDLCEGGNSLKITILKIPAFKDSPFPIPRSFF